MNKQKDVVHVVGQKTVSRNHVTKGTPENTKLLMEQVKHWSPSERTAVSVAVALRAARTALGWGQQEFADRLGVAKSTIARIETAESSAKVDLLLRAKEILKDAGIVVDFLQAGSDITLVIQPLAIDEAGRRLFDDEMRRIDRKQEKKG